ncbi:MAG: PaaI family thioesterase [Pseudomonadota bacterium]
MYYSLTEERRRFLKQDFTRGFIAFCGFEAVEIQPGAFTSKIVIRDEHRQQDGFIHAGVMAAMADHTAGYSAFTLIPEDHRILTIEFKINFLRPAFGQALICRAKVLKPGRKVLICESEIFDVRPEGEVLTAKALATMASVPSSELNQRDSE